MRTASEFFFAPNPPSVAEEACFFNALKMRNGTFKTTKPHRFDDIAPKLVTSLRSRLRQAPEILDIGASSGVSSVELREALETVGMWPRVTATDLFVEAWVAEVYPGFRALIDETGWPLQYELFGLAVRPWTRRLDYLTLAAGPRALARRLLAPRLRRLAAARLGRPVTLVARSFDLSDRMTLVRDDILSRRPAFVGRFDFVRAANVLHRDYFSDANLVQALQNAAAYLRGPGSLFLVCRTATRTGVNAATLFELGEDGGLRVAERFGAGSEIDDLVLALAPRTAAPGGAERRPAAVG